MAVVDSSTTAFSLTRFSTSCSPIRVDVFSGCATVAGQLMSVLFVPMKSSSIKATADYEEGDAVFALALGRAATIGAN